MDHTAIDLNAIRVFIAVVNGNSFSAAAKMLGITKSTVSRSIAYLEEHTGSQLFYRTTRKLELTSPGRALYANCREGYATLDQGLRSSLDLSRQLKGLIRVTSVEDLGTHLVVPAIAKFCELYPQVRFDLMFTLDVVDLVQSSVDLAVRVGETKQQSHLARKVGLVKFILVASPRYLERNKQGITVEDLPTLDVMMLSPSHVDTGLVLVKHREKRKLALTAKFQSGSSQALLDLAILSQGVALLPSFLCRESLKRGLLEEVCPGWHTPARDVSLVTPAHRKKSPILGLFNEFLFNELNGRLDH